jgi:hypothetical protein
MTSDSPPKQASSGEVFWCTQTGCQRPAVFASVVCRVHLAAVLPEGPPISSKNPELAGMRAAGLHFVRLALSVVPRHQLAPDAPRGTVGVAAVVAGEVDRQLAHMAVDVVATELADMFGSMSLEPPEDRDGNTLLLFYVTVPALDALAPRLEAATAGVLIEMFGADSLLAVAAKQVDTQTVESRRSARG